MVLFTLGCKGTAGLYSRRAVAITEFESSIFDVKLRGIRPYVSCEDRFLGCASEVEIVYVGDSTTHPVTKRHHKRTPSQASSPARGTLQTPIRWHPFC